MEVGEHRWTSVLPSHGQGPPMMVTPVLTGPTPTFSGPRPLTSETCPTSTPGTSVIALSGRLVRLRQGGHRFDPTSAH
jgi:hypothetical protein